MNTDVLAKLYDRLTPLERLPLLMAAVDRGDDAEATCLSRSAPGIRVGLPDYYSVGEGLLLLALFHMIEQLDLGLVFWQAQGLAADWEECAAGKQERARVARLWDGIRMAGYRLCIEADAWRRLCAELKIDAEALLRDLRGYDAVRRTEKAARVSLWTPEEAAAYLRRLGVDDPQPPTVEGASKAMRDFIDQRVAWWDQ